LLIYKIGKGRGHVKCTLVMGRIQVKLAITRMELVAAVNSVRFTQKVRESLKMPINEVKYCTSQTCHACYAGCKQS
jgi:hypothetical protein